MKVTKEIIIKNVVAKYVYLYDKKKSSDPNGEDVWSLAILINKEDKLNLDRIKGIFTEMFNEVYGGKKVKTPIYDGGEKSWEDYEGNFYINLTNHRVAPSLVGSDGVTDIRLDKTFEEIKSNDLINVKVSFWTDTESKYAKRINASVMAVQFVKKGKRYIEPNKVEFEGVEGSIPRTAVIEGAIPKAAVKQQPNMNVTTKPTAPPSTNYDDVDFEDIFEN